MPQGRLTNDVKRMRDRLEDAQAALSNVPDDLDETSLRVKQAMLRSWVVEPVLEPASLRLAQMRKAVLLAKQELDALWHEWNERGWSLEEDSHD